MRDETISISKAIAIILMVFAHAFYGTKSVIWINMFHMPLFFFCSGYCFKLKYLTNPLDYIKRKLKGIYFPFVKWSLIFLLLHNIFFRINIYSDKIGFKDTVSSLYSLDDFLSRLLSITTQMAGSEQLLGGYWFLKVLFAVSIIAFVLIWIHEKYLYGQYYWFSLFILSILGVFAKYYNLHLPYLHLGSKELLATIIFLTGYLYRKYNLTIHSRFLVIPIGLIIVTIGYLYWPSCFLDYNYINAIPFVITSIFGIVAVMGISLKINILTTPPYHKFRNLMIYIGNNTLTILTWHFLSFKLVSFIMIYSYSLPVYHLAEFPVITGYSFLWYIIYFIVGISIPLLMSKVKILK